MANINITTIQEKATLHTEGTHFDKRCQPVICVDEMKAFNSGLDAAAHYDATGGAISRCCNGKQKTAKGHVFCYVKDLYQHLDTIVIMSNKAREYDILVAKENARKELVRKAEEQRNNVMNMEFKMHEMMRQIEEAKANLVAAEADLHNFNA